MKKRYIYLNGKSNYNKPKVMKEIASAVSGYSYIGKTHVIYCIDTDRYDSDPGQQAELKEISQFCKDNGYDLIWFCRDVEDVFWGEQVPNADKTRRAAQFRSSRRIEEIEDSRLKCSIYIRHYSNILKVLDEYIEKKA